MTRPCTIRWLRKQMPARAAPIPRSILDPSRWLNHPESPSAPTCCASWQPVDLHDRELEWRPNDLAVR
jgi:hypothetical protein